MFCVELEKLTLINYQKVHPTHTYCVNNGENEFGWSLWVPPKPKSNPHDEC